MNTLFTAEAIPKGGMNQTNGPVDRIKIGLGIALLAALTGCVGYVDGRLLRRSAVVVPGPMCILGAAPMTGGAMCMFIVSVELQAVRWRTRPSAPAHPASGGHGGKR